MIQLGYVHTPLLPTPLPSSLEASVSKGKCTVNCYVLFHKLVSFFRALYNDGLYVNTTLYDVQLDTAVISDSTQSRAVYVEVCRCPEGYTGMSCQVCVCIFNCVYNELEDLIDCGWSNWLHQICHCLFLMSSSTMLNQQIFYSFYIQKCN